MRTALIIALGALFYLSSLCFVSMATMTGVLRDHNEYGGPAEALLPWSAGVTVITGALFVIFLVRGMSRH